MPGQYEVYRRLTNKKLLEWNEIFVGLINIVPDNAAWKIVAS